MSSLIDTTEMYLRTVLELEEDGVRPLRARLVDRLGLSGPAVSETVAKLAAEGLLRVDRDRVIVLSEHGRRLATDVLRKHRLAERLLTDVIGLDWERAHVEACRWEHVISDEVADRLVDLLGQPERSPYGNPIPGPDPLVPPPPRATLAAAAASQPARPATVVAISERLQADPDALAAIREAGLLPGAVVRAEAAGTEIRVGGVPVASGVAAGVFVEG